jgi:phenylalanyl-tRNA synthetase beta subunit
MVQAPVENTGLSKPLEATPDITEEQNKAISQPLSAIDQGKMDALQPKLDAKSKTEAPIDYTQAKGRESEITANLDSFKAK